MKNDNLLNLVRQAIVKNIDDIAKSAPNETLSGYAICTDDCLMTVFGVGATTEWCEKQKTYPDSAFTSVEWPYGYDSRAFDESMRAVQKRYAADSENAFTAHVDDTFATFVEALRLEKTAGRFGPDVYLLVTSTDPGKHLQKLATKAAKLLNSPELFEKFMKVYGY